MKKKIEDYLHLYFGQQVEYFDFFDNEYAIGTLNGIHSNTGQFSLFVEGSSSGHDLSKARLILRPLSSMTEEEAIDLYTIQADGITHVNTLDFDVRSTPNGFRITRLDNLDKHLFINNHGTIWKVDQDEGQPIIDVVMHQGELFRYLLSKGFDLFGLIESGLAIEKIEP